MWDNRSVFGNVTTERDRVNERIEIEGRKVWSICANVDILRIVGNANGTRKRVIEMREGHFVLGPDLLANDDLVNIVKFVPVFVKGIHVAIKWLELGSSWNGRVELSQ